MVLQYLFLDRSNDLSHESYNIILHRPNEIDRIENQDLDRKIGNHISPEESPMQNLETSSFSSPVTENDVQVPQPQDRFEPDSNNAWLHKALQQDILVEVSTKNFSFLIFTQIQYM